MARRISPNKLEQFFPKRTEFDVRADAGRNKQSLAVWQIFYPGDEA